MKTRTWKRKVQLAWWNFADAMRTAAAMIHRSWLWLLHVTFYQGGPGRIRKLTQTDRWSHVHTANYSLSFQADPCVRQFVLSNRYLNDFIWPDQDQFEAIARLIETEYSNHRCIDSIIWRGQVIKPYQMPALTLQRRPDDRVIPACREWIAQL